MLGDARTPADESTPVQPVPLVAWRPEHEQLVLDAGRGVRTVVVRPGIVYGGARGIIGDLLKDALNGLVRVVGEGKNHWPCIYDRDLADLYVRVATLDDASGIFHANDEADESVDDIVDAIARHAKMRPDVRHVPIEEARAKMGPVRRRAGARPDGAQPARPRARLVADAALGLRQRLASARRIPNLARGGVAQLPISTFQ